jgi:hypothetical protein
MTAGLADLWRSGEILYPKQRRSSASGSPPGATRARVLALLANGERVEVASARDAAGALAQARSFILSLDERRPGSGRSPAGDFSGLTRFVSVDVAEPRRD